jgi:hypothetical protein
VKFRKKKWRAEWLAYFDGWRLVAVAKEGRKWLYVIECATLTVHRVNRAEWGQVPKKPIVRGKIKWPTSD